MLISAPNGNTLITFIPESKYDFFCLGQIKKILEKHKISCKMEFDSQTQWELKKLTFDRKDLINLLLFL